MAQRIEGLVAAVFTPMHADGSLDPDVIPRQHRSLAAAGLRGAFLCGTTGEGVSLTLAERRTVAEWWRAAAGPDFALVVHVGANCLDDARSLAAHAQEVGASAVAAMAPTFFRPTRADDLADFLAHVASASPGLPFYYYHVPALSGTPIKAVDLLRAAMGRIPTLAGLKFTDDDLMDYSECVGLAGDGLDILFGRDEYLVAGLALGARGGIGTTYNFAAPLYQAIWRAFQAGDLATARAHQARSRDMVAVLKRFGVTRAAKAVMRMIGLDCGPVRTPLRDLAEAERAALRAELERVGFFEYAMRG